MEKLRRMVGNDVLVSTVWVEPADEKIAKEHLKKLELKELDPIIGKPSGVDVQVYTKKQKHVTDELLSQTREDKRISFLTVETQVKAVTVTFKPPLKRADSQSLAQLNQRHPPAQPWGFLLYRKADHKNRWLPQTSVCTL